MAVDQSCILFVTGKLAEPSLRRVVDELTPHLPFTPRIAVLPITVAALLTTKWIATHLPSLDGVSQLVLPGFCQGDIEELASRIGVPVVRGPKDLRDLPTFYGRKSGPPSDYGSHDIAIIAEINHAPKRTLDDILTLARRYRADGADVVDVGCDPGSTWHEVGTVVAALVAEGFRVSVDSFDRTEVALAVDAGAELVLSANTSNAAFFVELSRRHPQLEVIAIPDTPSDLDSLARTVDVFDAAGVRYRLDPIIEPIGFGFTASIGRYLQTRERFPHAEMMMGVGNLTELTDADSAGVNVILAGICQELGIRSVLTTEVANWCRNAVKEFALARRLVYYAIQKRVLPKRLEPDLILLRDPKVSEFGDAALAELASRITDRNYRLFAERGELHIMNGTMYLRGTDPFALFEQLCARDAKMDASHAFYLGYELAKAVTALTLGKQYEQDRALRWGFLTRPELSHRNPGQN